jgi:hypothetical protein
MTQGRDIVPSKRKAPEVAQDIDALLLEFRELRCAAISHMTLEETKASLLEIQRMLQDQFLTLTMGILVLVLAVIQTMVMLLTADLAVRATSAVLVVVVGAMLVGLFLTRFKTGRAMKLRQIDHQINSAYDAMNEYTALKFTAEENVIPALDASYAQNRITKERHDVFKKRLEQAVSFFKEKISEEKEELKRLESEEKALETDP